MSYGDRLTWKSVFLLAHICLVGCVTHAGPILSPVKGDSYEAKVPDTLDLAARAELSIRAMITQPEKMIGGGACLAKMFESMPLLRTMTGSDKNLDLENEYLQTMIFSQIEADGLHYIGRDDFPIKTDDYSDTGQSYPNGPFSCILSTGRLMQSLNYYYQMTGDKHWLERLEKMARGLREITLTRDDYAYYPSAPVYYEPGKRFQEAYAYLLNGGWQNTDEPRGLLLEAPYHADPDFRNGSVNDGHWYDGRFGVHMYMSAPIEGFLMWYRLSGDPQALDMAGRLVRFVTQSKFWDPVKGDDKSKGNLRAGYLGHLHGHLANLRAILEYASVTDDLSLKLFVREGYAYTRRFQAPRIGYFTEWTNFWSPSETCEIADMIALAIRLSDEGIGDYWEDVDQYVRNHFVEQQHTSGKPETIGAFVLVGAPADIMADQIAACCTENGSQALYYAWESIVREEGDMARVNLLLNRSSTLVDVDSHLPYEGKVVLKNKKARQMLVRIPLWVNLDKVSMMINEESAGITWLDRRVFLNALKPGDRVVLTFPMVYSEDTYWIQSKNFTYTFKGNTVVDVNPRPEKKPDRKPIYLRDHYRQDQAPLVAKTRFVPQNKIQW
jgi:hypothetical protein